MDVVVFTERDHLAGRCTRDEIGTPAEPRYGFADHRAGRCEANQIGKPIPTDVSAPADDFSPRAAFIEAFKRMGGVDAFAKWGKEAPDKFYPGVVRMASEEMRQKQPSAPVVILQWTRPDYGKAWGARAADIVEQASPDERVPVVYQPWREQTPEPVPFIRGEDVLGPGPGVANPSQPGAKPKRSG